MPLLEHMVVRVANYASNEQRKREKDVEKKKKQRKAKA